MSSEFSGSALGLSGKYKKEAKLPAIVPPCYQYIIEKDGKLSKGSIITIYGDTDGNITTNRIEV